MMSSSNLRISPVSEENSNLSSICSNLNIPINFVEDESPEIQQLLIAPSLSLPINPNCLLVTPPPSPTSFRRLSTSVYPPSSPRPGSPCSSTSRSPTPQSTATPPTKRNINGRRNTVCYNQSEDARTQDVNKKSLVLPKIVRRTSAPQLNEIPSLARAGISTHNLLALLKASESLKILHKNI